ncbi:MAG: phosphoribosylamine--glycine ligase [Melioribacteraceae bacterium]|nr:phosphoribosylamine--glycine ligase [Melioribacteraceae bacterium]
MNVLLIGSGGREHALALALSKSKTLNKLFCAPGNTGTKNLAENIQLNIYSNDLIDFCRINDISLVIIGPEQPLVDGISDKLRANGIKVFGPNQNAAEIEGNKAFAKKLMRNYSIPTAQFQVFTKRSHQIALNYLKSISYPTVIKASGLAAGKGVVICNDYKAAEKTLKEYFEDGIFGDSGKTVVIEEFLEGEEASIFAITDGERFIILPASQDHKRALDGDKGKNTGGMGAYAPAKIIDSKLLEEIKTKIIKPTLIALSEENRKYIGCLYAGIILTKNGPKVIEFNCRFGDPETQVVLPLIDGDILKLFYSAASEKLDINSVKYNGGTSVCVVAVSEGYPDNYKKGFEIKGINRFSDSKNIIVYHAGTKEENDKIVTNGGRVLGITSVINSDNLKLAKKEAYKALSKIKFNGITFRKDIADKGIK